METPLGKQLLTMKTRAWYMEKVNPPEGQKLELNMGEVLIMVTELLCDIRDLALSSYQASQAQAEAAEIALQLQMKRDLGDLRGR